MLPSDARFTASNTPAAKTSTGLITWSQGVTNRTSDSVDASLSRQKAAASAIAGAVLRPSGSSTTWAAAAPLAASSALTKCSCIRLVITTRSLAAVTARNRCTVWANKDSSPVTLRNCFGKRARESGKRRVPPPPASKMIFIPYQVLSESLLQSLPQLLMQYAMFILQNVAHFLPKPGFSQKRNWGLLTNLPGLIGDSPQLMI